MNVSSELLTNEENAKISEIVQQSHRKNQVMALGVVKLYLSDPSENHKVWLERVAGVAAFTKDYGRKSYYIQIFDMQYQQQVWEQEAYREMVYRAPETWLHSFEAEHNMVGLSFADEREAEFFLTIVQGKIDQRKAKTTSLSSPPLKQMSTSPRLQKKSSPTAELKETPKQTKKKKKQGSKKGISKLDISGPDLSTFVHVTGVRSDGTGGMKMVDNSHLIDPVLKKYLTIAGIDSSALGAQEIEQVKKFAEKENLYEQVEKRQTVRKEQKRQNKMMGRPPPPPNRKAAGNLQPIEEQRTGPPPIPGRAPNRPNKPPPTIPPPRSPKPQSTQGRRRPANVPPPPPSDRSGPQAPSSRQGGPPPPPPPGPGPAIISAVPKPPSSSKPNKGDLNSQINNFSGSLKKVEQNDRTTMDTSSGRGDLNSQIRAGFSLKKVDENDRKSASVEEEGGLMGALKGALVNIHEANFSSEEESDDDDDGWASDGDWDDE